MVTAWVRSSRGVLVLALGIQALCALFFMLSILSSVLGFPFVISWAMFEILELAAAFGLLIGLVTSGVLLRSIMRRSYETERRLRVATGAFDELMQDQFRCWGLTPAEKDVATFAIKGMPTADIARLRNTSEGTVKAQTNAIYRKAGVNSRSQLACFFIESLMDEPLVMSEGERATS